MSFLSKQSMRKLLCTECGKYLSACPIKLNYNGQPICGRCSTEELPINSALTAAMKTLLLNCSNDQYGCKETVKWENVIQHEINCMFARNEAKIEDETFPMDLFTEMKCSKCKCILNNVPIYETKDQNTICTKCVQTITEEEYLHVKRQYFLENGMKLMHFPCKHYEKGCKALLNWKTALNHETNCAKRSVPCLSSLHENCYWIGLVCDLKAHINTKHSAMMLEEPALEIDLTASEDIKKLFSFSNVSFLFLLKINAEHKKVSALVRSFGSYPTSNAYRFKVIFLDLKTNEEFVLAEKTVADIKLFHLVEEESVHVSIDKIFTVLGNFAHILCKVEILSHSNEGEFEEIEFYHCKNANCPNIGSKNNIEKHEDICNTVSVCKWPGCNKMCTDEDNHKELCQFQRITCIWFGCGKSMLQRHVFQHQKRCKHRCYKDFRCIQSCNFENNLNKLIAHARTRHPT